MKHFLLPAIAILALAGCATPQRVPPPPQRTGDPLVDSEAMLAQAPAKDRVLWQYRTALVAMRVGRYDEAKRILSDALLTVEGVLGKDGSAKKARGMFHGENSKMFIGEPYERVMAYYYRGILYWMDGEPDNARACFRTGELIDSDTENKEYSADYSLLEYLDGLATAKLGGDGSDNFQRANKFSRMEQPPAYNTKANVLFFLEYGRGPTKFATGEYREQLRFRPGASVDVGAVVKVDGLALPARPYDDLYFQATTRGGRVMDHVLANKAVFKSTTDTAGNAAIIGGAVVAGAGGSRTTDEIGLGLVAAGLISKLISAGANPAADVRSWDNLPQYLSFASAQLAPGEHTVTVEFNNAGGMLLANFTKTLTVTVPPDGKDTVVFVSDRR